MDYQLAETNYYNSFTYYKQTSCYNIDYSVYKHKIFSIPKNNQLYKNTSCYDNINESIINIKNMFLNTWKNFELPILKWQL